MSRVLAALKRSVPAWAKDAVRLGALAPRLATASRRLLPDFIIIGAQRAGTTSLYNYLTQHPAVARAWTKEVHFFDLNYSKGLNWYRAHFPTAEYKARREKQRGQTLVAGEASPYYLFHPLVAARVREHLADAKLIVLLRNPVDRAYSHYAFEVNLGYEPLSFEEAIEREPDRVRGEAEKLRRDPDYFSFNHLHYTYLARGLYAEQLAVWLELFPREQFRIIQSEELFAQPARLFRQSLDFLGLPAWEPKAFRRFNVTEAAPMNPATRRRLLDYFAPHNQRLYGLLGKEYSWSK